MQLAACPGVGLGPRLGCSHGRSTLGSGGAVGARLCSVHAASAVPTCSPRGRSQTLSHGHPRSLLPGDPLQSAPDQPRDQSFAAKTLTFPGPWPGRFASPTSSSLLGQSFLCSALCKPPCAPFCSPLQLAAPASSSPAAARTRVLNFGGAAGIKGGQGVVESPLGGHR